MSIIDFGLNVDENNNINIYYTASEDVDKANFKVRLPPMLIDTNRLQIV